MWKSFLHFGSGQRGKDQKSKVDFVSLMAHQIKNPLSSMKLSLTMLLEGDFGPLAENQKVLIKKILQKDEMLITLVDDILKSNHLVTHDHSAHLVLTDVDLEDLIRSLISLEEDDINQKKIEFQFNPSINHPVVRADKQKLFIAFQNILENAIKYTPKEGSISVALDRQGSGLVVKVRDSGIGIPKDQKRNIFTKFFRAENATKNDGFGSGLGLFIAKAMVELNHGKIWFESEEGRGSTFFISLPIS